MTFNYEAIIRDGGKITYNGKEITFLSEAMSEVTDGIFIVRGDYVGGKAYYYGSSFDKAMDILIG